jgi:hypothetical protein
MIPSKKFTLALFSLGAVLFSGCSGVPQTGGSGGTGGGTGTPLSVSGTVVGMTGTGLILENNGTDDQTIKGTGNIPFTFKTNSAGVYKIVVKTQPSNPAQNCSVTNGSGTTTVAVSNVQVACGVVYTVGGSLSGLAPSSSITLQNNAGDDLKLTSNGTFTFPTSVVAGGPYAVTISAQPTAPKQTCSVANGTGTASVNVTNIQITCPQPSFTVAGTVIGLVPGPGDTIELQNNAGDNLFTTGDNQNFTFATKVTSGGIYNVSMFLEPNSQPQACNIFNGSGIALADVSNVLVDCQHNDWAWITGPTKVNQYASVTTSFPLPFPSTNNPGGRDLGMTWTDSAGRKWMFGGFGYPLDSDVHPGPAFLDDMWVYDPQDGPLFGWLPVNLPIYTGTDNKLHADATQLEFEDISGTYGSVGAAGNPGSRWGGTSWTDASGNLWMFGGQGFDAAGIRQGLLNDMWEFVPGTIDTTGFTYNGQWVWQGGSNLADQPGNYGTLGVGSASNLPGGRWGAATYQDAAGVLWMFGGQGYDSTAAPGKVGLLNDLWKYTGGQWTWVGGTNTADKNGVYGTQGTPAAGQYPGGRQNATLWVDLNGNVWMFGGFGLDSVATVTSINGQNPTLNDLWEFTGGQWIWVSGSKLANQTGTYGTQLVAATGNVPGSRWGAVGWSDAKNSLWLFSGWGYDSDATHGTGFLNDVWEYNTTSGQWKWWKGSSSVNQNGAYLIQRVSFVDNVPGARRGTLLWQPDSLQYIWVFGGQGYDATTANGNGYLGDLWTYLPYP